MSAIFRDYPFLKCPQSWMMISLSDQEFFSGSLLYLLYFYKYAQVGISFHFYSYSQLLCSTVFPLFHFLSPLKILSPGFEFQRTSYVFNKRYFKLLGPKVETAITKVGAFNILEVKKKRCWLNRYVILCLDFKYYLYLWSCLNFVGLRF